MINDIQKGILQFYAKEVKTEIKENELEIARLKEQIQEVEVSNIEKNERLQNILQGTDIQNTLQRDFGGLE